MFKTVLLGQWHSLSDPELEHSLITRIDFNLFCRFDELSAAGCVGGIAGIFNVPLVGMFFASEIVLLGTYEIGSFAALAISSAMATVVSRAYYGEVPAFPIPPTNLHQQNLKQFVVKENLLIDLSKEFA